MAQEEATTSGELLFTLATILRNSVRRWSKLTRQPIEKCCPSCSPSSVWKEGRGNLRWAVQESTQHNTINADKRSVRASYRLLDSGGSLHDITYIICRHYTQNASIAYMWGQQPSLLTRAGTSRVSPHMFSGYTGGRRPISGQRNAWDKEDNQASLRYLGQLGVWNKIAKMIKLP